MSKTRQWAMLTAVVCLAVLAAGWFLVIKPERSHAASLRTQKLSVDNASAQLQTQVAQLRQQQKDLPAQQKLLSQIATKIPDNPALPALIRQLSAAADGSGVDLVSLSPGQPTVAAAPAGAPAATSAGAAAASPLANIPLTLTVQGSYFNLEQFFNAIESLNRAMLVSGFNVSALQATTSGGAQSSGPSVAPGTLSATINAQVFESPQVAAAPTTTSTSASGH